MLPQLGQPPIHILKGRRRRDIVNQQCTHSPPIVRAGDGAVAFLAGRVPDLRLDGALVQFDGAGGEFDADGRLGVGVEFVAGEAGEEVGLADSRVSDEHDYGWRVSMFVPLYELGYF